MQYLMTFLEGILSFISPCMLPMLPIYVSYFAGSDGRKSGRTFVNALAFVSGFTLVFCLLGLVFGSVGSLLGESILLNTVCGALVVILGLSYLGIIKIPLFKGSTKAVKITGILSAFLFGTVFSVSLTPCVGAFLGSALAIASSSGNILKGLLLLLCYSAGLGIPFLLSALLIDNLRNAFSFIKKHYKIINTVSGLFLIIVGICIMSGVFGKLLSVISLR